MPWEVYEPIQCQKFFGSTEIIGDEDTGQHRHHHHGGGGHKHDEQQEQQQQQPPPAPPPQPQPETKPAETPPPQPQPETKPAEPPPPQPQPETKPAEPPPPEPQPETKPAEPPPPPPQPKRRKAMCTTCQQPISSKNPGCTALGQIFHINCFKCKTCDKTLAGSSFYNIENNPTCGECYNKTLENCHKCHQKITDRLLRARGGVWHVNCFTCESCKKSLDGVPFTSDPENNVYCVGCYQEKFAPRCAVCNQAIVPREGEKESVRVIAMDKSFHPACYKCEDCGMQLSSKVDGAGCYPLNDHLYCKDCNVKRLRAGQH